MIVYAFSLVVALLAAQSDTLPVAPTPPPQTVVRFAIVDSATESPITGARVDLGDGPWRARSDDRGLVQFKAVPVGVRRVLVRAIGYDPVDRLLVIRAATIGDSSATLIEVSPIPTMLDSQRTTATRPETAADGGAFEVRRRMGLGHFFTQTDFMGQAGRTIADIVAARVAGIRSSGSNLYSTRGARACPLDVYIDGAHASNAFTLADIELFDVAGIEVYSGTNIPPQFNTPANKGRSSGSPGCGVLVVWLRKY